MTPEGRVKEKVKRLLRKYDAYWHCPVQNGMGAPALDFMQVTVGGLVCAIECKAGSGTLTARQRSTVADIRRAGGTVLVVTDQESTIEELEQWLITARLLQLGTTS